MINHTSLMYALVMLFAGIGIPIMAAINGGLGMKLQNPAFATTILFAVGFLIAAFYMAASGNLPKSMPHDVRFYQYFGGLFVVFYALSVTWIAPKFGVGNAISYVLLGQLISMTLIDHFKLFGAPLNHISVTRFVGLIFMAIGVFLVVKQHH